MEALIVDDSRAMRLIISGHLQKLGFLKFREAGNGKEALTDLEERSLPDVVIVDWNMPVMNGLAMVEEMRKFRRYNHVPVLVVTSEIESTKVFLAMHAGANEYLMKPFTAEALRQKLCLLGIAACA